MSRINAKAPNRPAARRTPPALSRAKVAGHCDRTDQMCASLTVRVPATPHKLLNPNTVRVTEKQRSELDWPLPKKSVHIIKYALRQQLKDAVAWSCIEQRPKRPLTGPVMVHVVIGWEKGRMVMDFDNAIASCKGALDGLILGGWIVDDMQVQGMTLQQTKDPEKVGYMVLTVEPVEGASA